VEQIWLTSLDVFEIEIVSTSFAVPLNCGQFLDSLKSPSHEVFWKALVDAGGRTSTGSCEASSLVYVIDMRAVQKFLTKA